MNEKIAAAARTFEDVISNAKTNVAGLGKVQKDQMEKAAGQFLKGYEDLASLAKGNVDAVVASGNIVAKGAEEAGQQVAAFTQASLQKQAEAGKALLGITSFQDLIAFQSAFLKSSAENLVREATRFQELSAKITSEAIAPINARVNANLSVLAKAV